MNDSTPPELDLAPPAKPPRKKRKLWRRLLRWTGFGLLGLITGIILLLVFLPLEWIVHTFVVPEVRKTFQQDNIEIGACEWSLTGGFEIHDIRVGPPAGYTKDVLTLKRLAVHYDLFSIVGGDFQLREVAVEEPHVFAEIVGGKPNVLAMLEKLPKSEPPPPEEPGEPGNLKITIHDVHVTGFEAGFDDGNAKLTFGRLDVNVDGTFSPKESHLKVKVTIGGTPEGKPNINVSTTAPQAIAAALEMKLGLGIQIDIGAEMDKPKAGVDMDFLFASRSLDVPGMNLPPILLTAKTQALADVKADTAGIKLLTAHFNGEEILRMKADLDGLKKQAILATIEKARLPFAAFVPYVQPFLPPNSRFELVGEAGIEGLVVRGEGPALAAGALPAVQGRLFVRGLGLDIDTTKAPPLAADAPKPLVPVPALAVKLAGIGVEIDLFVTPDAPPMDMPAMLAAFPTAEQPAGVRPTALLKGQVGVGLVDGFGARVEGLVLDLAAGATLANMKPTDVAASIGLKIPVIQADVPKQGKVQIAFGTALKAGGNLPANDFALESLTVNVSDTVKLAVDGWVKKMGQAGFMLNAKVEPLNLGRAIALAPPGARANMPKGLSLSGAVDTNVHVEGELPPLEELSTLGGDLNKVFALPVKFDITQGMSNLSVRMPAAKLSVSNLSGAIRIHGKPSDVNIEIPNGRPLGIDRIAKEDLGVIIRRLGIPLQLRFTPLAGGDTISLKTGASMTFEPTKGKLGPKGMLLAGGMATSVNVHGHLPPVDKLGGLGRDMGRALGLPLHFDITQTFNGLSVKMPADGVDVRNLDGIVRLFGRPSEVNIETAPDRPLGIQRISHADSGVIIEKLGLPLKARLLPLAGEHTVEAKTGVTVGKLLRRSMGLRVEGVEAIMEPKLKVPVLRVLGGGAFDVEKVDVAVRLGLESFKARLGGKRIEIANKEKGPPGTRTKILADTLRFTYDPNTPASADGQKYVLAFAHGIKLGNLTVKESRLEVKNLVLEQRTEVAGLSLSGLKLSQPVPTSKPRYVHITTRLVPNMDADGEGSEAERRLSIAVGGTPLDRPLGENELDMDVLISLPRLRYPPVDTDVYAEMDRLDVRRLEFFNRSHGGRLSVSGNVKNFIVNGSGMPQVDLSMFAGLDLPKVVERGKATHMITLGSTETHDKLSLDMGGKVGLEARIRNLSADALEVKGVLVGDDCHIWSEKHGQDPSLADGTQLFTIQNVHVKNLTMNAPLVQRLNLDYLAAMAADKLKAKAFLADVSKLWPAGRDIFEVQQSPVHHTMQSYSNSSPNVTIDAVDVDKEVTYIKGGKVLEKANSPLAIDRLALNMGYENWVFDLERLYIQMLGGDIGGRVAFQLKGLAPPDLNLVIKTQIGGINLAALNPRRDVKKKYSAATEIKVDADLAFGWKNRDVDGAIRMSKLSLNQLDELLKFSDPGGRNQQIQDQRTLFKRVAFLNPSVKYVNLTFEYANMDLETRLDAIVGVRNVLNSYLDGVKVEGLDARQVVENFIAEMNFIPPTRDPPEIGPAPDEDEVVNR